MHLKQALWKKQNRERVFIVIFIISTVWQENLNFSNILFSNTDIETVFAKYFHQYDFMSFHEILCQRFDFAFLTNVIQFQPFRSISYHCSIKEQWKYWSPAWNIKRSTEKIFFSFNLYNWYILYYIFYPMLADCPTQLFQIFTLTYYITSKI